MTLFDFYPSQLSIKKNSPLMTLLKEVPAYSFESQELVDGQDLTGSVGIGRNLSTQSFMEAFKNNQLNNIVQIANDDLIYELFIASIILKKPKLFINNPVTILNSGDTTKKSMHVWQENFNATVHKPKVLDGINDFMAGNKSMSRLSENVMIIIDELFSNALYNAPADENGYPIFKAMDRHENVKYPGNKNSRIFAIHTDKDLFIGCVDPWGSIDRDHIVSIIHNAYSTGQVTEESKGAGLGLRMMLDRSRSLYIVSEHRERTLVCCHMRLNISLKKVENVPKQLHMNCFG